MMVWDDIKSSTVGLNESKIATRLLPVPLPVAGRWSKFFCRSNLTVNF